MLGNVATPEVEDRLLTAEEVAAFLGISVRVLYRWRTEGYGPKCAKVGRRLRYRRADIEAWIDELQQRDQRP